MIIPLPENCVWLQQFMSVESLKLNLSYKNILKKPTCTWACIINFKQLQHTRIKFEARKQAPV